MPVFVAEERPGTVSLGSLAGAHSTNTTTARVTGSLRKIPCTSREAFRGQGLEDDSSNR